MNHAASPSLLRRLIPVLGIGALAVAGGAYLFLFDPAGTSAYPSCPFRHVTGFYCPGCGSLRAMHELLHGNLYAAFRLNPMTVVALPFIAYGLASQAVRHLAGRGLPTVFVRAGWIWALLVVMLAYWALRNVPGLPSAWLAPHN